MLEHRFCTQLLWCNKHQIMRSSVALTCTSLRRSNTGSREDCGKVPYRDFSEPAAKPSISSIGVVISGTSGHGSMRLYDVIIKKQTQFTFCSIKYILGSIANCLQKPHFIICPSTHLLRKRCRSIRYGSSSLSNKE